MAQRRVTRAEKTTFVVFLGIFALSSFCFALFNLTLGPEPLSARQAGAPFAELEIVAVPKTPELERLVPFWAERGFDLLKREKARELNPGGGELRPWVRGSETWVFVPRTYGLNLEGPLLELCGNFLAQGWSIQIERVEYGFELAFWSVLAEAEQKVPVYTWRLEILNPRNYTEHRMGFIPVMGELFDPWIWSGVRRKRQLSPSSWMIGDIIRRLLNPLWTTRSFDHRSSAWFDYVPSAE